jgi:hypothetical protein
MVLNAKTGRAARAQTPHLSYHRETEGTIMLPPEASPTVEWSVHRPGVDGMLRQDTRIGAVLRLS